MTNLEKILSIIYYIYFRN